MTHSTGECGAAQRCIAASVLVQPFPFRGVLRYPPHTRYSRGDAAAWWVCRSTRLTRRQRRAAYAAAAAICSSLYHRRRSACARSRVHPRAQPLRSDAGTTTRACARATMAVISCVVATTPATSMRQQAVCNASAAHTAAAALATQ